MGAVMQPGTSPDGHKPEVGEEMRSVTRIQSNGCDIEISESGGFVVVDIATHDLPEELQYENGIPKLRLRINEDARELTSFGAWVKPEGEPVTPVEDDECDGPCVCNECGEQHGCCADY